MDDEKQTIRESSLELSAKVNLNNGIVYLYVFKIILVNSFVFKVSIKFCDQSGIPILDYVNVSTLAVYIGEQRDFAQGLR